MAKTKKTPKRKRPSKPVRKTLNGSKIRISRTFAGVFYLVSPVNTARGFKRGWYFWSRDGIVVGRDATNQPFLSESDAMIARDGYECAIERQIRKGPSAYWTRLDWGLQGLTNAKPFWETTDGFCRYRIEKHKREDRPLGNRVRTWCLEVWRPLLREGKPCEELVTRQFRSTKRDAMVAGECQHQDMLDTLFTEAGGTIE